MPGTAGASGAMMQDPTGFPGFHNMPAPEGPAIAGLGDWGPRVQLSQGKGGGYRPQVAVGSDGLVHALFYERTDAGDLIRHRVGKGGEFSAASPVGFEDQRNWGPDLVVRDNGSVVCVFDHAQADFSSRGWLTKWEEGAWSAPEALTEDDPKAEIGSGHVAHGTGDLLYYVYIGKQMDPSQRFQARGRVFDGQSWGPIVPLSAGKEDAWHTNVERRPDGSALVGFDVGTGGGETTLYVGEARDGRFSDPMDMTTSAPKGERPHFAFGPDGQDHLTWFHKENGQPKYVYVRSGSKMVWGETTELSQGYGGFHFDPEIAVNAQGVRVVVWGWDAGSDAELVYSVDKGQGWSAPQKVDELDWGKPGLASLVAGPDGRFHVVWNQGVRGENHVYYRVLTP